MNSLIQLALDLERLSGQPHHVCVDRHGDVRVISGHMGNLDEHDHPIKPVRDWLDRLWRDCDMESDVR